MRAAGLALVTVGAVLLLAGLVLGFVPLSAGGVGCGSAFNPSDDAFVSDLADSMAGNEGEAIAGCDDQRGDYRPVALALSFFGLGLLDAGVAAVGSARGAVAAADSPGWPADGVG